MQVNQILAPRIPGVSVQSFRGEMWSGLRSRNRQVLHAYSLSGQADFDRCLYHDILTERYVASNQGDINVSTLTFIDK